MNKQKVYTNIRLNLDREADRKAWEYLRNMDRKKYKSYSRAIVTAVNDYFDRQERMKKDHYLETREKEDAFLELSSQMQRYIKINFKRRFPVQAFAWTLI